MNQSMTSTEHFKMLAIGLQDANKQNMNLYQNQSNNSRENSYQYKKKQQKKRKNFNNVLNKHKNTQIKYHYVFQQLDQDIRQFEIEQSQYYFETKHLYEELVNMVFVAIQQEFPNHKGSIYGSFLTQLCMPWSDVDIVFFGHENKESEQEFLSRLSKIFHQQKDYIKSVTFLDKAYVPLLKLSSLEKYNNIKVDITFKQNESTHLGQECVELVKQYLIKYQALKPLLVLLKQIVFLANLHHPYQGGVSSYTLTLIVVGYFQQIEYINKQYWDQQGCNYGEIFVQMLNYYIQFEFENMEITPVKPDQQFIRQPIIGNQPQEHMTPQTK